MWRAKVQALTTHAVFKNPASENDLESAENALEILLPIDLRNLLSETDGIDGQYGIGLIWSCDRIASENRKFRTNSNFLDLYMPFDSLLFFGDVGNGDQFAFTIKNGQIRSSDVYLWTHEDDSRKWVAPSLERYLDWWLSGKIKC